MNNSHTSLSRRRILLGAAAASAVTVAGATAAPATTAQAAPPVGETPSARPARRLVARDRIATARLVGGTAHFQADFHERLDAWLAFWSANSPRVWSIPVEIDGRVAADGDAFTLHTIRVTRDDETRDAFAAGRSDAAHLATLASLHHHFPSVRVEAGGALRVADGPAGWSGSADQVAFAVTACRELWGLRAADTTDWGEHVSRAGHAADPASRSGWAAFTRASLRRGLRTESY
ncbi:hypothetical protein OG777_05900 [Micromonospora peucetia]|uniref:hypothetical protein n=1 Tax=Micromonospora peucetia TaxID=47871 RepID=UPI00225B028A|nr:hypothetical protein [Micromonospora peucetia]MCX4386461.1 hypothetical protein [Micromonospora peucetia]